MRELPEGKIACKQIRTGEGRWVRISNENMAHKTPTNLANIKICRCCCKPLGSNDHLISLFGERESNHGRIQWNYWPCCKPRHACAVKPELLKSWSGNLIIPELHVLVLTKRHVGSGNEILTETTGVLKWIENPVRFIPSWNTNGYSLFWNW